MKNKWLHLINLIKTLLRDHQELITVKYFTSRVTNNPDKLKRQTTYLEAIKTTGVKILYGRYQAGTQECYSCGHTYPTNSEKMTDVNIATEMLCDGFNDLYDTAFLISGDSDLMPPIKAIHRTFENKRVFVGFPPKRHNQSIASVAKGHLTIGRKAIKSSQLPIEIRKEDGYLLTKPREWF
ncbi:NYN domain-containing protein [bacterium]|nr:NYN domain-containing protein [bacterium]